MHGLHKFSAYSLENALQDFRIILGVLLFYILPSPPSQDENSENPKYISKIVYSQRMWPVSATQSGMLSLRPLAILVSIDISIQLYIQTHVSTFALLFTPAPAVLTPPSAPLPLAPPPIWKLVTQWQHTAHHSMLLPALVALREVATDSARLPVKVDAFAMPFTPSLVLGWCMGTLARLYHENESLRSRNRPSRSLIEPYRYCTHVWIIRSTRPAAAPCWACAGSSFGCWWG